MPRMDNEFGNKYTDTYMAYLKRAMGLAGMFWCFFLFLKHTLIYILKKNEQKNKVIK
jgi:hypothetical protein